MMAAFNAKILMALLVAVLLVLPVGALYTVMNLRGEGTHDDIPGAPAPAGPEEAGEAPDGADTRAGPRAVEHMYGTWVIANGESGNITGKEVILYGHLEVQPGGTFTMDDGTLKFDVKNDDPEVWKMSVSGGATFSTKGSCYIGSNTTNYYRIELGGASDGPTLNVVGCTFDNVWDLGVHIQNAIGFRFTKCTFNRSEASSMRIEDSSGTFTNCTFSQGTYGAYVEDCSPKFDNCKFASNALNGIKVTGGSSSPTITGCTVKDNGDPLSKFIEGGISFIGAGSPTVTKTHFENNAYGIYSRDTTPSITRNTFTDIKLDAIYVKTSTDPVTISHNSIDNINGQGIKVSGAPATVENNTIDSCKIYGDPDQKARGIYIEYAEDFAAINNTVTNCDIGFHINAVEGGDITGNQISQSAFAVYFTNASGILMDSNRVANATEGGIFLNPDPNAATTATGSDVTMVDNILNHNDDGISVTSSKLKVFNGTVTGSERRDLKVYGESEVTINGMYFPGLDDEALRYFHSDAAESPVTVGYYGSTELTYENGNPVSGAKVWFIPGGDSESNGDIVKVTSDGAGHTAPTLIPSKVLWADAAKSTAYSPYTVQATKGSLLENKTIANLNNNQHLKITFSNIAPTVPVNETPFAGSYIATTDVEFTWQGSSDDYPGDSVQGYTLQVAEDAEFITGFQEFADITLTGFTVEGLTDETWYHWRVKAIDSFGLESDWSPTVSFRVDTSNKPPEVDTIEDIQILNGVEKTFLLTYYLSDDGNVDDLQVTIDDIDLGSYNLVGYINLVGQQIVAKLTLQGTDDVKTVKVSLHVSDGSQVVDASFNIVVSKNPPPQFVEGVTRLVNITMEEDADWEGIYDLNDFFIDPDMGDLTFQQMGDQNVIQLEFGASGNLGIIINEKDFWGPYNVTIRVKDTASGIFDARLNLYVNPVDDPPETLNIQKQSVEEGERWELDLTRFFSDVENDTIVYTCNKGDIKIRGDRAVWDPPDVNFVDKLSSKEVALKGVVFTATAKGNATESNSFDIKLNYGLELWQIALIMVLIIALVIGAMVAYIKHKQRYEIHHIFLIDNNGILLFHKGMGGDSEMDEDVLSGMLSAVRSFVKDSFTSFKVDTKSSKKKAKEDMKTLAYGDLQICLEYGDLTYLSVVMSGFDAPALREKMANAVNTVETKFRKVLKDFDGNVDQLKGINVIMRDVFAQDLASTPGKKKAAPPPATKKVAPKKGGAGKKKGRK